MNRRGFFGRLAALAGVPFVKVEEKPKPVDSWNPPVELTRTFSGTPEQYMRMLMWQLQWEQANGINAAKHCGVIET